MKVSPFRGIRYNQRIVEDLARVLCPPYDVITPEQQKIYYEKSNYNAIRLEFPAESRKPFASCHSERSEGSHGVHSRLSEAIPNDKYRSAATTFQQWLKDGVLQLDGVSSFYLHDHRFEYSGEKKVRRGLIARVKLEPWGNGIYPHEETFSKAKSDRLHLVRACRANFSPLLSLYHDPERRIASILSEASRAKPVIETTIPSFGIRREQDESSEAHTLWAITDPEIKRELSQLLSSQSLYIADGHHRYETALNYQQERAQVQSAPFVPYHSEGARWPRNLAQATPYEEFQKEAFNYVMMELVDFSDPGLVVLPLHRLVRGIAPSTLGGLEDQLRNFFVLEFIPLKAGIPDWSGMSDDSCLGILGLQLNTLVVLRRCQDISLETVMPDNRSRAYQEFDVSILNHIILDKVLSEAKDLDIAYTVDLKETYQQIEEGKYQLAFLLKPPQPEMVKAVAEAQGRMPSKSTYFYPKLPTGLVINPLD